MDYAQIQLIYLWDAYDEYVHVYSNILDHELPEFNLRIVDYVSPPGEHRVYSVTLTAIADVTLRHIPMI